MSLSFSLDEEERRLLGRAAVDAIEDGLGLRASARPDPSRAPRALVRPLGCFVTLKRRGALRGCIGNIVGRGPLLSTVWRMAQAAAFDDPRFPPLRPGEWRDTELEITVLDELSPCPELSRIELGRHGLLLSLRGRSAVFLPQVPVEQGWDLSQYLLQLCRKAGLPDGAWRHPEAELLWYEGLAFPVAR